jgi:hypothetical protein
MIATALQFVIWIAGLFGFGKKDPVTEATKVGRELGHGDGAVVSLKEVQDAKAASDAVDADLIRHPERVRDHDPFERPD